MKKLDEKKWRKFDLILQALFTTIAVTLGDIIATKFFHDLFGIQLVFCIVFIIVLMPLQIFIEGVVEQSEFLRKPFEKEGGHRNGDVLRWGISNA